MAIVRTAVVGHGVSAKRFHLPYIEASDRFHLNCLVSRSHERDEKDESEYHGLEIVRSYREVLEMEDIDLLVICTPNQQHFSMAKAGLLAGKHVVVEKPFVSTVREGQELIELASRMNRNLFVFHNRRFDGDFMTVKKVIGSRLLGDIKSYESQYDRDAPFIKNKKWKEEDSTVSMLHDLGTHLVDQAVSLFGVPNSVSAVLTKERVKTRIYDGFRLNLVYQGNPDCLLRSSPLVKEQGPKFKIEGSLGTFIKSGIDPQEDDIVAGKQVTDLDWGTENDSCWGQLQTSCNGLKLDAVIETLPGNYMGFYDNVADVLNGGSAVIIDPNEALITVKIIEAAFHSHESGTVIKL